MMGGRGSITIVGMSIPMYPIHLMVRSHHMPPNASCRLAATINRCCLTRKRRSSTTLPFALRTKYLSKGDRTLDQMIQSARSGKQNILEGSKAGTTSKETEIKLTNVGRASLEELLADYRDYLRVRDLRLWHKDSTEALFVRKLGRQTPQTFEVYREFLESRPAEVVANIAICLIHQTNYLLDQQLKTLEQEFLEQGGLRERMTRARLNHRHQTSRS